MKKIAIFVSILTLVDLLGTTSAFAESEYMCGSIPFIPNKPPKESCGWRCGPVKTISNYLVVNPNDYAKYSYAKAKSMYNAGKCEQVYTIKRYTDECGGNAVVKKTASSTWTEITGGNETCRMKQYQNTIQKQRKEVEKMINGY